MAHHRITVCKENGWLDGWMNRAETTKTEMCNLCSVKVVYMRLKTAYLILRLFCFEMKCSCHDVSSPVVVDVVGGGGVDGCRNWDNGSRKTNDRKLWRKFSLIVVAMARIMMMMMAVVVTTVTKRSSDDYIRYEMATLKQMENRKSYSRSSVQFHNCDTQHVCVWVSMGDTVHACVNKIHMCNGPHSYIFIAAVALVHYRSFTPAKFGKLYSCRCMCEFVSNSNTRKWHTRFLSKF